VEKGLCFLDFDGVVNTLKIEYKDNKFITRYYNNEDNKLSNEQAILWISKLCLENNLDIVITSAWRRHCILDKLKEILYNSGVINNNLKKSLGIKDFLKDTNKYVIIDDESYSFKKDNELINHLVICDSYYGFGVREYEKAKSILKNKTLIKK